MIDLVDYGGGNIGSMQRCLERLKIPFNTVRTGDELTSGSPAILPGVGAFAAVMKALDVRGFIEPLQELLAEGRGFLGVCIGLQVLFDASDEAPGTRGLGAVPGRVVRYSAGKIPHIGWNNIVYAEEGRLRSEYGYFVNSFFPVPENEEDIWMVSDYHGEFCAGIRRGRLQAFQFHPEKSGPWGNDLIRRWADAL